jgi:hypothetical protein
MQKRWKMQISDVLITPTMAQDFLSRNKSNRPLREKLVNLYARDMVHGSWQMNGETIKISKKDELLDGQHRLSAIIKSGKTVRMPVVRNLPEEVFHTIDTGMRRSASQILGIAGYENTAALASAARWLFLMKANRPGLQKNAVTPQEILDTIKDNPMLHQYTHKFVSNVKTLRAILPSPAIAIFTVAAQKYGSSIVDLFMDQLASGEGLKKRNPVYELRERLFFNKKSTAKLKVEVTVAILIKAFNAFVHNKEIGVLHFKPGKDTYPQI